MNAPPAKSYPRRGNHLPVLMTLVPRTTGPILELGSGLYSTPYLHWACFPDRPLVTYENTNFWFRRCAVQFPSCFHAVRHVPSWDSLTFEGPWSIALVDNEGPHSRGDCVRKLTHAEYVVAHDCEKGEKMGYREAAELFKYSYIYTHAGSIQTMVLSNVHDLTDLAREFDS
mgnify:FL=1